MVSAREHLESIVEQVLGLRGQHLVGCRRRAIWYGDKEGWRYRLAYGLLATVGQRRSRLLPDGQPFDFFIWTPPGGELPHLLVSKGGPWRPYWGRDIEDTWVLAGPDLAPEVLVLHELNGRLSVQSYIVPAQPDNRLEAILAEASSDPPGRISKMTPEAVDRCRTCRVRSRCDATDAVRGEQTDWSPRYRSAFYG